MRFLSLFSGIEAASQAWVPLGWVCVGVAEIEPFPCSVLAHHYPGVPNLGNVEKITQHQIEKLGHIDVVIFGFPCQDLSVAGKRKGLKHDDGTATRSGLFFTAMQIVEWSRARWAVAENVPGLFSSRGGADFATVVGEMAGAEFGVPADGWRDTGAAVGAHGMVEWGVLDAQWFGLAQRRKRVFLVRDTGDWASRAPVLLEPESLLGNNPPRRETRERVTGTISARTQGGGGLGTDFELAGGQTTSEKRWPADLAPSLDTTLQKYQGLDNQHIRGGQDGSSLPEVAMTERGAARRQFLSVEMLAGLLDKECAVKMTV